MNIDQLKKQAKALRDTFPGLVHTFGNKLTLAQAQATIAQLNGYPSWERMVAKSDGRGASPSSALPSIQEVIRAGLYFAVDEEPSEMPTAFSSRTGDPTRYAMGYEAILRFRRKNDQALAEREDEALYELMARVCGESMDGTFTSMPAAALEQFDGEICASLQRAPLNIEGHSCLLGVRHALGRYSAAHLASEPVITTLIDLLPTDRTVQVCYGLLANRPFFRLLRGHLLVLDRLGRHSEANAIAKLGYRLWPMDNMGFRYLTTRASRALDDG